MLNVLYTTGYLGQRTLAKEPKVATFDAMVQRVGLLVCDIRHNPWSLAPCWRKAQLCDRFGNAATFPDGRYLHVGALGNVNYNRDAEIEIADLAFGVDDVIASCEATGLSPLLLCGCEDYECCHRFIVGKAFAGKARKWIEVTRWTNPFDFGHGLADDVYGDNLEQHWDGGKNDA